MNRQENIDLIREAVLKVHNSDYERAHPRTIRLADVLLAILKKDPANRTNITLEPSGDFLEKDGPFGEKSVRANWNLRQDDLTQQSDETIQFLADLLK